MNAIRTTILLAALTGILLAAGQAPGGREGALLALVIAAVMARGLEKLEAIGRRRPLGGNPATAHLFIVNPLHGGGLASLFSTHPPIAERVARLRALVGASA